MNYKFSLFIFLVFLIISCNDEQSANPGDSDTYIKFFGASNSDVAYVARETSDGGSVLLGTTEIDNEGSPVFKIKVIRVDGNGNQLWEKIYPKFEQKQTEESIPSDYAYSLTGRSIIIVNDGYIIVGDSIQNDGLARSSLFLMKINDSPIDDSFEFTSMNYQNITGSSSPYDIQGLDIIEDSEGNFRTISNILDDGEIIGTILNRVNADLSIDLDCFYESEENFTLVKSLTENENGEFIYGGTDNKSMVDNPKLIITPSCQKNPSNGGDLLFANPANNFVASQVIATSSGYAMVGTNETGAGTTDVFFALFGQNGAARPNSTQFYDHDPGTYAGIGTESAEGLAITSTTDGGYMIVGSTLADTGGEADILLIKTDALGNIQWTKVIGDVNEENATHVEQAADGGYLVFGNTEFGGIDTMVLIKTDKNGNIN